MQFQLEIAHSDISVSRLSAFCHAFFFETIIDAAILITNVPMITAIDTGVEMCKSIIPATILSPVKIRITATPYLT